MARKKRDMTKANPDVKVKMGVSITRAGSQSLSTIAKAAKMSRSQLFEELSRGQINISSDGSEMTITLKTSPVDANENSSEQKTHLIMCVI